MKGYRTLIWSVFIAVVGVLQVTDWATVIPPGQKWTGAVLLACGAITAALRYITTTDIGKSS